MTEMGIEGPYEKYRTAYYDTSKYLRENEFSHPQYSGYTSKQPMTYQEVRDIIEDLSTKIPYLKDAVSSFHVTSVKRTYEVTEMLKNEHDLEILEPANLYKLETDYGLKIDDTKEEKRHIRFDYGMDLLEENFKKHEVDFDVSYAWKWTRKYWEDIGFKHEQGSVYISPNKMTDSEIITHLLTFSKDYPHLTESFKSVQVTSIGRTYDITDLANGKLSHDEVKSNDVEKTNELQISNENNLTLE